MGLFRPIELILCRQKLLFLLTSIIICELLTFKENRFLVLDKTFCCRRNKRLFLTMVFMGYNNTSIDI